MKILQLISGDLGQGGAERLVIDLANAQAEMGHDVTVCSFRKPNQQMASQILPSVRLCDMGKLKGFDWSLMFRIYRFLKKESFDIVNCHLPALFPYFVFSLFVIKKTKFFYTIHSDVLSEEPRKYMRDIRRYFARSGKLNFVGISKKIGADFQQVYNLPNSIPVIYNGRKTQKPTSAYQDVRQMIESFKQNENTKVFVAVGRMTKEKNFDMLVRAFSMLADRNIVLMIIGRDPDNFIDKHKDVTPSNTHYIGSVPNVFDFLLCSDCFIMSSFYEGLPIAMIEAMSASLPIISTPVGGIPDIVEDGENGYLSASVNLDDFINAINRFLNDDKDNVDMTKENNRQKFVNMFMIEKTAESYINLYMAK